MSASLSYELRRLAGLGAAAVSAYREALSHIRDPGLHRFLARLEDHHQRYLAAISREVGELETSRSIDSHGLDDFLLRALIALQSSTAPEGAVRALLRSEGRLADALNDCKARSLPPQLVKELERYLGEIENHRVKLAALLMENSSTAHRPSERPAFSAAA